MIDPVSVHEPNPGYRDLAAYRDLIAILPEAHWLLAADGRVVAVNPAAAALVRRPAEVLAGLPLQALVVDEPTQVARYLTLWGRSRELVPGALTVRTADGADIPCRCDGAVLHPAAPNAPALLLVRARPRGAAASGFVALTDRIDALNREMAHRAEAERVLQQQAALLDQTQDPIFVWALEREITYCNHAAEEVYGWSRAETIGQRMHELLRTEAVVSMAEIERILRERGEWRGEVVHTTRHGRQLTLDCRMVLLHADGGEPLVLETLRDVTDVRRAQIQLEAAQRLEAVGRLAGGVAHEINNALQGAVGFSSYALRRLAPHDPVRDDVAQALKASERAAAITQGLLAFSRRQVLQPADVNLGAMVEEFAPMLRQALGRDRELRLELPPAPVVVRADRGQLEQVLLNFVLNARDATEVGGRATVRIGSSALTDADLAGLGRPELSPGAFGYLEVEDDGRGMDPATSARIFEPFYTTKAPGQGTGLGLSVVHGIVHQSGGAIAVRSAPAQGSTFTVYLPLLKGAVTAAPSGQPRIRGGAERILVVDDERHILLLTKRLLEEQGYTVVTATDGADALRCIAELEGAEPRAEVPPVDLVVSDIIMPAMGGRELGGVLARRYPALPVLYISGHPGEEMVNRGLLEDGAAFMQKPFHLDHFLLRVRALLDRVAAQ